MAKAFDSNGAFDDRTGVGQRILKMVDPRKIPWLARLNTIARWARRHGCVVTSTGYVLVPVHKIGEGMRSAAELDMPPGLLWVDYLMRDDRAMAPIRMLMARTPFTRYHVFHYPYRPKGNPPGIRDRPGLGKFKVCWCDLCIHGRD
jgi:hypothetical protein